MEGGQQPNPFAGGSPTGSPTAGATTELGGLEVARRMVEATEAAALAAQKAVEMVQSAPQRTASHGGNSCQSLLRLTMEHVKLR